jgi:hypothetical protein
VTDSVPVAAGPVIQRASEVEDRLNVGDPQRSGVPAQNALASALPRPSSDAATAPVSRERLEDIYDAVITRLRGELLLERERMGGLFGR